MNFYKFKNLILNLKKNEKNYLRYKFLKNNNKLNLKTKLKANIMLNTLTKNKFKLFCWKNQTFRAINKTYKLSRHSLKNKYSNGYLTGIKKSIW